MGKRSIFAFLAVSMLPALAGALEIQNKRVTHGPMGATRNETTFLPGDYLFMSFDMEGLAFDPKTGKANYETILELYNSSGKKIFEKKTNNVVAPMLGGTRIPGDLHVIMGTDQPPGKYVVRLIVVDRQNNNAFKHFDHRFELLPQSFGLVGVTAPAIGFPGQHYLASFALVNMGLDAKEQPNAEVVMRVKDAAGRTEVTRPILTFLPRDMPATPKIDLKKENFVPMQFPIYLNRPGRFVVEIQATDKTSGRSATLNYTLNVVDLDSVINR